MNDDPRTQKEIQSTTSVQSTCQLPGTKYRIRESHLGGTKRGDPLRNRTPEMNKELSMKNLMYQKEKNKAKKEEKKRKTQTSGPQRWGRKDLQRKKSQWRTGFQVRVWI